MEKLISSTAAYAIFSGDAAQGRLSHAYLIHYADGAKLKEALKLFALVFFGCREEGRVKRLVESEAYSDMKIYPRPDKKLSVDAAAEIVDDAYLKPVEGDKKLYVISGFEEASALFQNKLLKILEEPPQGVYFLLGAASLSPVLDTVQSRVKTLEIPPFTAEQIYGALERRGSNPENAIAAQSCGGVLSAAERMLDIGGYAEIMRAAREICSAADTRSAIKAAVKYGGTDRAGELLAQMQRTYFAELEKYARDGQYEGALAKGAVIYAAENINKAFADMKFNANFPTLLYDFALRVALENEKWSR